VPSEKARQILPVKTVDLLEELAELLVVVDHGFTDLHSRGHSRTP